MPVKTLTVEIDPVQDLHGQESPYPAGGGKNKLSVDVNVAEELNPNFTRNGNTLSRNGVDFTFNDDGTIKVNGTATGNYAYLTLCEATFLSDSPSGTYILNGCPSGGSASTYNVDVAGASGCDSGNGISLTYTGTLTNVAVRIRFTENTTVNNLVFKPMIRLSTVTDGTFAPYSNVCPISGWTEADVSRTGVNVWDETWEGGSISPTTGQNANDSTRIRTKGYISVVPNTAYYCKASKDLAIRYYDRNKSFIGTGSAHDSTVTTPANCYYMRFAVVETSTYGNDISINYPSTDTQYHAYSGSTAEYEFPQEAGTVYGGSLTIHQDGTGELVVDRAITTIGSLYWAVDPTYGYMDTASLQNVIKKAESNSETVQGLYCSAYMARSAQAGGSGGVNGTIAVNTAGQLRILDTAYTDADDFKTAMSSHTIVYPLATPVTYTLSEVEVIETLKGVNNVWADCGDVSVTYPADTKLYISKQLSASQRLMELIITANHEESMKATKAYSSGNLLIVNGTLYKATTSIANGATLTVGTNVTATTVANELALLA